MSVIAPFPHRYVVTLSDGQLEAPPRPAVRVGAPPQFGGSHEVWSPEELLVSAALLCLKTTFDHFARREALAYRGWRGSGTGVLDKTREGPAFSAIELNVELSVAAEDEERAERIFAAAERNCIISRSLRAPVTATLAIKLG
jgi:organic hydroperoxide reductase OsmC/OhrA